jgi:FlaA1/EpsC-like NDP-sugar epimerase
MGASKLMGERLITAANNISKPTETIFTSTRFGNVLGSSGSVVPIFVNQIKKGGPVTLTSREMSRFVMSIDEAIKLVLNSALIAKGGEIFVTKMHVINIKDLAEAMIDLLAPVYGFKKQSIEIIEIGTKPGEKEYEELMNEEEMRRTIELKDFFSILPAFRGMYKESHYHYKNILKSEVSEPYISKNSKSLNVSQIKKYLETKKILNIVDEDTDKRYWPGDKEKISE